ncbi:outer membrane protein assembly factor BamC [Psychromonas aquatilis]|uniref:Outer membrane protein assembly factor BamC n=1 Tax=Psychromonas aquatilis TaxID=2005072 RepID=A0ABU9GNS0_9GAMM
MRKNKVLSQVVSLVVLTSAVSSCARFEERTQAEGNYDYQEVNLHNQYDSGEFSSKENRTVFKIDELTEKQEEYGSLGRQVDVRPPAQLIPILDGIYLDNDPNQTKIIFDPNVQSDELQEKVWGLIEAYLAEKQADPVINEAALAINTGKIKNTRSYGSMSTNTVEEVGDYNLQLLKDNSAQGLALLIDVQSYQLNNDGDLIEPKLGGRPKHNIEVAFANDLLAFAYAKQQAEALEAANNQPLPIKLGFDDNHQTAWIVDDEFLDVWNKLPSLLSLMSFELVEEDKNLGYFLVEFEPQDAEYWAQNNLNPIDLEAGEYFVQLGELTGGETSIIWLDDNKKPLEDQVVTELYFSITDKIRTVILENDKQTKPL